MSQPKSRPAAGYRRSHSPGQPQMTGNAPRRFLQNWPTRLGLAVFLLLISVAIYSIYSQKQIEQATLVVSDRFGKIQDLDSVNGFSIFGDLLKRRGCQIQKTTLLAPNLDQHDVLIWLHASATLPQPEAFQRVEEWLDRGNTQVVFIGNDHNAKPAFMEEVYRHSTPRDRQWARVVARLEMSREMQPVDQIPTLFTDVGNYTRYNLGQSCRWFHVAEAPDGFLGTCKVSPSDGEAGKSSLPGPTPFIRVHGYLDPDVRSETLIRCVDGKQSLPIVWKMKQQNVMVVSSAAFLANYGCTLPENRPLLERVLEEIPRNSRVLVLESGPGNVPLSSTPEDRMVKTWSWMKHGPFPIAVLHVLTLAVIFCFARFPVFGRPKQVQFRPRNDFGLHLEEVGRLLRNTGEEAFAKARLQYYYDVIKRSLIGRGPGGRS